MARFSSSSQILPSNWLGLAWVYSALLWLLPIWLGWTVGSVEQMVLALLRLLATVFVGVGICGDERWGWATAYTLSFVYLLLAGLLASIIGMALAARPAGALSWQPVLWGFNAGQCVQLEMAALLVMSGALLTVYLLTKARGRFDVPQRQVYGILVKNGLIPALMILIVDGAMLLLAWR